MDHVYMLSEDESLSSSVLYTPQAVWTRFFPASYEISRLLSQGEIGEVKMVRADFGAPIAHIPRSIEKELGGGALLDIGIYCLQFVLMVYNGEKPECIQATGVCLDTGTLLAWSWELMIVYGGLMPLYTTAFTLYVSHGLAAGTRTVGLELCS